MSDNRNKKFMQLYREHHSDLSNYCRSLMRDTDAARDLMSETITRALESFHKIKDISKFKYFLFSVASNINKEQLRKKQMANKHAQPAAVQSDTMSAGENNSAYTIINQLSREQAEVFTLYEIVDMPLSEIADMLDTNVSTVKTRLRRARNNLRTMLSKEFNAHISKF